MERNTPENPFRTNLSVTRLGSSKNSMSDLDVVTEYIRTSLDSTINDVGFVYKGHRFEATFNRFLRTEPTAYPVRVKEHTETLWKRFMKHEVQFVQQCIFSFCFSQGLVKEEMEPGFFAEPQAHTQLPKEYESVRGFAKALVNTFVATEYPSTLDGGGFFEWVKALEAEAERCLISQKSKVATVVEERKTPSPVATDSLPAAASAPASQTRHIVSEENGDLSISLANGLSLVVDDYNGLITSRSRIERALPHADNIHVVPDKYFVCFPDRGTILLKKVRDGQPYGVTREMWAAKPPDPRNKRGKETSAFSDEGLGDGWKSPKPPEREDQKGTTRNPRTLSTSDREEIVYARHVRDGKIPNPATRGWPPGNWNAFQGKPAPESRHGQPDD